MKKPSDHFFEKIIFKKVVLQFLQLLILPNDRLRDRTLAVPKNSAKITFFSGGEKNYLKKIFFFYIFLLDMPKYWVKIYLSHGKFSEVGEKQKA